VIDDGLLSASSRAATRLRAAAERPDNKKALKLAGALPSAEPVVQCFQDGCKLCYKQIVFVPGAKKANPQELHVYVDAVNGKVLSKGNFLRTGLSLGSVDGTMKTFYSGAKSVKIAKDGNTKNKMPFFMIDTAHNNAEVYDMKSLADPADAATYDPYANKPLTYTLYKNKINEW